nr:YfzA family protein [Amphibacillus cookii]
MSPVKRWLIIIGIFLLVQMIFFGIDGTMWEPKINDSGRLFARIGRWILDSKFFTEWMTPYAYPFFNMFMTIHIIVILFQAIQDMSSSVFSKNKR